MKHDPTSEAPRPAPLIKRLCALVYDSFILIALSLAYGAVATAFMVTLLGVEADNYHPMQNNGLLIGWVMTIIGFYWFFWKRAGQTVGMRAWRLKVIALDASSQLSHKQCIVRILSAPFSLGLGGLGYLWCLFSKERAAWHDLLSQTRVVVIPKN